MKIPPLDLKRQYEQIKTEVEPEVLRVCNSQHFILGPDVTNFEKALADYCGVKHAIGVASGTDAITLALLALGIGAGDEVITSPFTFIATAEPITLLGATPVFTDIDPKSYNLDPAQLEEKITDKTKAIIVVHLYGQCADMNPILEIAKKHQLPIIEDTAQAIGAPYGPTGQKAGSMGTIGCLSFFPSKNLGGFGDGGAVLTNDESLAEAIKELRVHGSKKRYYHDRLGVNGRLDALQAAVLNVKLKYLDEWLEGRRTRVLKYNTLIEEAGLLKYLSLPSVEHGNTHTYHQYVLSINERRDELLEHLTSNGIGANIYYPVPLHRQNCFKYLGLKEGDFPITDDCSKHILSLPIFPELLDEEQVYIVEKIKEFFN